MSIAELAVPPLRAGNVLTLDEFLRRWEAMPNLKRAELIGGIVYMPSPVGIDHGDLESVLGGCLAIYAFATPGTRSNNNSTCLLLDQAPQPDCSLRLLPSHGGQTRREGRLLAGIPEFVAEVCASSAEHDLHQKFELYERGDVQEYLTVLVWEHEARWHRRMGGRLVALPAPADGIYRSDVFPGLWINTAALLEEDLPRLDATLREGLASPEHARFVAELAARAQQGPNPGAAR